MSPESCKGKPKAAKRVTRFEDCSATKQKKIRPSVTASLLVRAIHRSRDGTGYSTLLGRWQEPGGCGETRCRNTSILIPESCDCLLSWELLSPPPHSPQIHPKQKAILGSNFYLGVQAIKGLWIYPASHLRAKDRTQRRPSLGTRQNCFSRALCSGCFIEEACLDQRLKKKNNCS